MLIEGGIGGVDGEAYDGNKEVFQEGTRIVMGKLLDALPGWVALI